jgi:hypothetical protein
MLSYKGTMRKRNKGGDKMVLKIVKKEIKDG